VIAVLTHHWAKPDKVAEAHALLDRNGAAQRDFPGFGARQTLHALDDETKISTLVTWQSSQAYDAWRASPERAASMAGADLLWARPPESERFQVAD
jgi:heme-degrading monooxygenase HmoA